LSKQGCAIRIKVRLVLPSGSVAATGHRAFSVRRKLQWQLVIEWPSERHAIGANAWQRFKRSKGVGLNDTPRVQNSVQNGCLTSFHGQLPAGSSPWYAYRPVNTASTRFIGQLRNSGAALTYPNRQAAGSPAGYPVPSPPGRALTSRSAAVALRRTGPVRLNWVRFARTPSPCKSAGG
jgi:hypothetical protein